MIRSADPGKQARAAGGIPVVPAVDGYRAFAIVGVVLFHVVQVSGLLAEAGGSRAAILLWGVLPSSLTAMFIVSGFVMFLPVAARRGDFGSKRVFAARRAARVFPAYWLALVVALLLLAVFGPELPRLGPILAHFGMVHTPSLLLDGPVNVNGVSVGDFPLGFNVIAPVWTLPVEIGFYILLPFIAGFWFKRPFIGVALAAAMVVAWHAFAVNVGDIGSAFGIDVSAATEARFADYYASQFPSWALAIGAGMTSAWLYVWLRGRYEQRSLETTALWWFAGAGAALVVVLYAAGKSAIDDPNPFLGLFARQSLAISLLLPVAAAATMLAYTLVPARLQRPCANAPVRWFADITYSIYLIHLAVIWVAVNELSLPNAADSGTLETLVVWSALVFSVSTLYAALSARFVERPIRRWARRYRPPQASDPELARAPAPVPSGTGGPSVSIVIPTYNRARWLRGAIDSVLDQDYPDLEVVVVDDGSSDDTPALLERYAKRHDERRFRFLRQDNAGQATALNRGNAAARGELIGYLSDDDALKPGALARLAGALAANPRAAVAYPAYEVIDADGRVEDTIRPIRYSPLEALRLHDTVIGPGGLARRDALEAAGGWDPDFRFMGDLILWMGIGLAGDAIRIDEPLARWRRHPGSATIQLGLEHAREHLRVMERGEGIEGLPPLSPAVRAEALRNACLTAALFGGSAESWPGDRFVMFDLQRMAISAWSSGQSAEGPIDWERAERTAALYRELVELTVASPAGTGGRAGALRLLARAGVTGASDGSGSGADPLALRTALVEAAIACEADLERAAMRFVVLDRSRVEIDQEVLERLVGLGFSSSADQLAAELDRRRSAVAERAPDRLA